MNREVQVANKATGLCIRILHAAKDGWSKHGGLPVLLIVREGNGGELKCVASTSTPIVSFIPRSFDVGTIVANLLKGKERIEWEKLKSCMT